MLWLLFINKISTYSWYLIERLTFHNNLEKKKDKTTVSNKPCIKLINFAYKQCNQLKQLMELPFGDQTQTTVPWLPAAAFQQTP